MGDTVTIELTREELHALQDKIQAFGLHDADACGGHIGDTGPDPLWSAIRRKLASPSLVPPVKPPVYPALSVRACDCELRNRLWDPNTGKCRNCRGAFATGAARTANAR